jgi:cell division septal protein FtsQ
LIGKKKDFHKFYTKLKSINFPVNEIESFNYFNIGRWDIILKNKKIVKLPDKNYIKALKNFTTLMKDKNFDKYKSFDYRINDQLILN